MLSFTFWWNRVASVPSGSNPRVVHEKMLDIFKQETTPLNWVVEYVRESSYCPLRRQAFISIEAEWPPNNNIKCKTSSEIK